MRVPIRIMLFIIVDEEGSEHGSSRSRTSSVSGIEAGDKKNKKPTKQITDKEKEKDKGGIFKGWGQMFRYVVWIGSSTSRLVYML